MISLISTFYVFINFTLDFFINFTLDWATFILVVNLHLTYHYYSLPPRT
jgi:hypothetical protein